MVVLVYLVLFSLIFFYYFGGSFFCGDSGGYLDYVWGDFEILRTVLD